MYTKFIENNSKTLYVVLFSIGALLSLMYSTNQILDGDQMQMIHKGYLAFNQGTWLSYGNAASVVGNVPGMLSTAVMAFPLSIYDSPYSPLFFLFVLHVGAFLLLDSVIKKAFSPTIRIAFIVLYWLNPWVMFETFLYNPSYLFFFSALHLYSAFNMRERKSFLFTFLHVLSTFMAMQFHYSWIILPMISFYLLYRGMIKVHWVGFISGFVVAFISLIPYFQELMVNKAISEKHEDDHYLFWGGVHVYPVFKSALYWFRYASSLFSNRLILGVGFEWISDVSIIQSIAMYIFRGVVFLIGGLSVVLSIMANRYLYMKIKTHIKKDALYELSLIEWLLLYAFAAFVAVIISAIMSPIIFNYWHLIIVFSFALLPLFAYLQAQEKAHKELLSKAILALAIYFSVVNAIVANDSFKYSYTVDYPKSINNYVHKHGLEK